MFPIRDSIPSRRFPVINVAIIVVCSVVFLFELSLGPHLEEFILRAAFVPARLFGAPPAVAVPGPYPGLFGNLLTILVSMFLHGGWMHIIGNMWFLAVFGDNVEDVLGHGRYLLFYLGGGIFAALAHGVTNPHSVLPTVGASGAIAAVLGAYMVWFPHSRVHTLIFLGFFVTTAELPAILFLGIWFVLQFVEGTMSMAAAGQLGGVAWFAHVGGFVYGFLLAKALRATGAVRIPPPRHTIWYH